jgi:hypothetical protein
VEVVVVVVVMVGVVMRARLLCKPKLLVGTF